jgi:shikimate kinase
MKLFILGFMGSGKTKLGKKVAHHLELPFFDLDQLIEEKEGKTITRIFEESGEDGFRLIEQTALESLINQHSDFVLSTGGGTPCFFNNMYLMNEVGKTIYLKLDANILFGRLKSAQAKRPLIANLTEEELKLFIEQKLLERESYYSKAQLIADAPNLTANKILSLI